MENTDSYRNRKLEIIIESNKEDKSHFESSVSMSSDENSISQDTEGDRSF